MKLTKGDVFKHVPGEKEAGGTTPKFERFAQEQIDNGYKETKSRMHFVSKCNAIGIELINNQEDASKGRQMANSMKKIEHTTDEFNELKAELETLKQQANSSVKSHSDVINHVAKERTIQGQIQALQQELDNERMCAAAQMSALTKHGAS